MKKIFLFLAVAGVTLFSSCEGPEGPTGYSAEAIVYELLPITFQAPSYGVLYTFPQSNLNSDHVLVYRLSGSDAGADVWQLIPQYHFFDDGTLDFSYNYDATQYDVNIFIEGQDLETLSAEWTQDQIFRAVIIPGQLLNSKSADIKNVDTSDYNAVVKAYNIKESDIKHVGITKNK